MIHPENFFTQSEKDRIAEAVKTAELETSGEIVPYVVGQSDQYPEASHRAGGLLAFIVLIVSVFINLFSNLWLPYGIAEMAAAVFLAYVIGMLIGRLPLIKRMMVSAVAKQSRVDERAAIAFLTEEVFLTRDRTGILIFLSLLERRVRILGDGGINAVMKQDEWDSVVDIIVQGIRNNSPASGMIEAIGRCGQLLKEHGLAIKSDDTNEIDNNIRMSDK
jgi:putative membrane protein